MRSATSLAAMAPGSAQTTSAASNVAPPLNAANLRNTTCSAGSRRSWLQSTRRRSVCWRGSIPRPLPVRSEKRSSRRAVMSTSVRERSRAAASSMASGNPSRRSTSCTARACSSGRIVKSDRTAVARAARRSRASSRASGGIAHETSPGTASGSRLVASTYSPGHWARRVATSSAAASMTCSQLSSTTSARRPPRASTSRSSPSTAALPVRSPSATPSARATSATTAEPGASGASSTSVAGRAG